jgi:hypothetical protein
VGATAQSQGRKPNKPINFHENNGSAEICRFFCRELEAVTGLKIYFLPNTLGKTTPHSLDEPYLGCPLLGLTALLAVRTRRGT